MYNYSPTKKRQSLKRVFPIFLIILFLLLFPKIIGLSPSELISPIPPKSSKTPKTKEELLRKIRQLTQGKGSYSIYIYELKNKDGFGINEETIFTAASVNKIPILAALYFLAGKGEIDLEKKITLQKDDIQDYGTGSIRYDLVGTQYSLKTLARLMMEKSDNTASYLLAEVIIGMDKIQELINSWGLTQTKMKENKTSNADMAVLLSLMYQGKITNKALTKEMIGFMDDSDFEDRIPALLPKNIKVYHKIGNEVGNIHDVGIIDLPRNPYYLGILSTDVPSEEEAKQISAQVSKLVFEFEKRKI